MAKKILLVSDSPYATTGLGRMSKYFMKMLPEFEWSVWGFLHPDFNLRHGQLLPYYNDKDFEAKFKIASPRMFVDDQYGFDILPSFIEQEKPDFVITSMDFHLTASIMDRLNELRMLLGFKWINYFPMDREDFKSLEVDAYRFPDVNVCITKFGVQQFHKYNPKVHIEQIYHPIEAAEFPAITRQQRRNFKLKIWPTIAKNTFVVGTVNRSFARKDTARLVMCFNQFLRETEDTFAYLHGSRKTAEGMDLAKLAYENEVPQKRLSFLPSTVSEVDGVSQEVLNQIYRSLDLFVTVSAGEGFGFSTVEALLTETPIIAPRNTCFPELVQDFGYLIDTAGMVFHGTTNTAMWPYVNIEDVVEKMHYVKNNYEEAKEKAKAGSKWVKENLNLDIIASQWRKILQ